MEISLILAAFFVSFGSTFARLHNQVENRPFIDRIIEKRSVRDNERGTYREVLEQEAAKGQRAFRAMEDELWTARKRNFERKTKFGHENFVVKKRETDVNSLDYLIDAFLKMDKQEQGDILKFVDPHVASELRNLPSDPTAIDPATLKRLREHLSYHSAMLSVRDSIKYVYVREVLRHANQEVVKLNRTAAKEKLTLDKQLWTDFIRDKKANGTSPIVRRLLLKRNESIEDFSESMVWIYNFAYDWLNFFRRVRRNETIDPVKHEWPFTKKHLDVVNIFRESLKQDPLDMVWLDEEKKLVLPQMLVVKTMVPGSRGSWEDLGLHPAKNV